jgi:hypothetical protein
MTSRTETNQPIETRGLAEQRKQSGTFMLDLCTDFCQAAQYGSNQPGSYRGKMNRSNQPGGAIMTR